MVAEMRTYVDVTFNSDGVDPIEIVKDFEKLGLRPIRGVHDFCFDWSSDEDFRKKIKEIHEAMKGKIIQYRLNTVTEEELISDANFVLSYR